MIPLRRRALCALAWLPAAAAADAPALRLLVPYGSGGEADRSARLLAAALARQPGMPKIRLEHRTAHDGAEAALALRQAPADGNSLLIGRPGVNVILPAIRPSIGYSSRDFLVLGLIDLAPMVCAARADAGIGSLGELLARLRQQPGRLRYATAGASSIQNLTVRYLLELAGLPEGAAQALHKSTGAEASQALLAGEADFVCNPARTLIAPLRDGRLRGLLTTAQGRLPQLPELRNARELGLKDLQKLQAWTALLAPRDLPAAQQQLWRERLARVAADTEWQRSTLGDGGLPALRLINKPQEFIEQQARLFERLAIAAGLRQ